MKPTMSEKDSEEEVEDENWEYDIGEPIPLEEIENDDLDQPRSSISMLIPFIEFDKEERTLNFSRRQR